MWLGANRPVAGALAPKPARSEANKALSPLRGGRGSNPSHRGSALRASPPCTTGAVCKQKWDAFSSYELAAKCGHVFRTYLEYCIDIDTVFSYFHCNDMGAMTFFFLCGLHNMGGHPCMPEQWSSGGIFSHRDIL